MYLIIDLIDNHIFHLLDFRFTGFPLVDFRVENFSGWLGMHWYKAKVCWL